MGHAEVLQTAIPCPPILSRTITHSLLDKLGIRTLAMNQPVTTDIVPVKR